MSVVSIPIVNKNYPMGCEDGHTFRFTSDAGALEYLNGKRFEVDKQQIWFLEEFQ